MFRVSLGALRGGNRVRGKLSPSLVVPCVRAANLFRGWGVKKKRKKKRRGSRGEGLVLYPRGGIWSGAEYWILRGSTSGDGYMSGHVSGDASEVSAVRWSISIRRCFPIETTSQFAMTIDQYLIRILQLAFRSQHLDLMKTGIIYGSRIIHHRCSWLAVSTYILYRALL